MKSCLSIPFPETVAGGGLKPYTEIRRRNLKLLPALSAAGDGYQSKSISSGDTPLFAPCMLSRKLGYPDNCQHPREVVSGS